jgi:hypothetical protein
MSRQATIRLERATSPAKNPAALRNAVVSSHGLPGWRFSRPDMNPSGEELCYGRRLHQFTGLVQVVVDDRFRGNSDGVVDSGQ